MIMVLVISVPSRSQHSKVKLITLNVTTVKFLKKVDIPDLDDRLDQGSANYGPRPDFNPARLLMLKY